MFYSHELLSLRRKGKFSIVWYASTHKISNKKVNYHHVNVVETCSDLIDMMVVPSHLCRASERMSLRLASKLLFGTCIVYKQQVTKLFLDVVNYQVKITNISITKIKGTIRDVEGPTEPGDVARPKKAPTKGPRRVPKRPSLVAPDLDVERMLASADLSNNPPPLLPSETTQVFQHVNGDQLEQQENELVPTEGMHQILPDKSADSFGVATLEQLDPILLVHQTVEAQLGVSLPQPTDEPLMQLDITSHDTLLRPLAEETNVLQQGALSSDDSGPRQARIATTEKTDDRGVFSQETIIMEKPVIQIQAPTPLTETLGASESLRESARPVTLEVPKVPAPGAPGEVSKVLEAPVSLEVPKEPEAPAVSDAQELPEASEVPTESAPAELAPEELAPEDVPPPDLSEPPRETPPGDEVPPKAADSTAPSEKKTSTRLKRPRVSDQTDKSEEPKPRRRVKIFPLYVEDTETPYDRETILNQKPPQRVATAFQDMCYELAEDLEDDGVLDQDGFQELRIRTPTALISPKLEKSELARSDESQRLSKIMKTVDEDMLPPAEDLQQIALEKSKEGDALIPVPQTSPLPLGAPSLPTEAPPLPVPDVPPPPAVSPPPLPPPEHSPPPEVPAIPLPLPDDLPLAPGPASPTPGLAPPAPTSPPPALAPPPPAPVSPSELPLSERLQQAVASPPPAASPEAPPLQLSPGAPLSPSEAPRSPSALPLSPTFDLAIRCAEERRGLEGRLSVALSATQEAVTTFFTICPPSSTVRFTAAVAFNHLLSLHKAKIVKLSQDEPYGDIVIQQYSQT